MSEEKEMCSCGFPQSYPIPHEHDQTEREKVIIKHYESLAYSSAPPAKGVERVIREIITQCLPDDYGETLESVAKINPPLAESIEQSAKRIVQSLRPAPSVEEIFNVIEKRFGDNAFKGSDYMHYLGGTYHQWQKFKKEVLAQEIVGKE